MVSRAFGECEDGCECYGCKLRAKSFSTKLDTGVSGVPGLKMTSPGQDGPTGRDGGGKLL